MSIADIGASKKVTKKAAHKRVALGVAGQTATSVRKRDQYKIIIDGVDYTPKPLLQLASDYGDLDEIGPGGDSLSDLYPTLSTILTSGFASKGFPMSSMAGSFSLTQASMGALEDATESFLEGKDIREGREHAPSQFLLPKFPDAGKISVPQQIYVTLKETSTFFLLERPSMTVQADTEEGKTVMQSNATYLQQKSLETKKKIAESETQTPQKLQRTQVSLKQRCKRVNAGMNVTTYEIYKTYKMLPKTKIPDSNKTVILMDPLQKKEGQKDRSVKNPAPVAETDRFLENQYLQYEKEFIDLASRRPFKNAVYLVERILASNEFGEQQKIFKGIIQPDPLGLDIRFDYRPELLWTFFTENCNDLAVTCMCWNKKNENLLAVAYGTFYYRDKSQGLVCCWCVKNPVQPERTYYFDAPVQCLEFSRLSPNLLALGFYNGDVMIIDVSSEEKSIVARNNMKFSENCAAVWTVTWFRGEDHRGQYNQVLTAGQDGRVYRYRRAKDFTCFPMMRVSRMEGKVKGIEMPRKCFSNDIPVTCNPAALVLTKHPTDKIIYFVGTDEGCIHKCSINYLHQHLDLFLAHRGAVYTLQFSPFWDKILMTSGADWCVRIWAEGIDEPLIELKDSTEPVQGACWSPAHSTILASVSGRFIHVWDIRRKTFAPITTICSPSRSFNSCIQFTGSGRNLVVGDIEGHVHVFALKGMPFSPFFQKDALVQAITKALVTNPDRLSQFKKIEDPSK